MIDEIKDASITTALGVLCAACLDYFVHHPATAISTIIMLLMTWERYKTRRHRTNLEKAKSEREQVELSTARMREKDMIERMRLQDIEDNKDRKPKNRPKKN